MPKKKGKKEPAAPAEPPPPCQLAVFREETQAGFVENFVTLKLNLMNW